MSQIPSKSRKSRKPADILAGKPRCIYCAERADTVEHMPSKALFRAKDRPSGLEFPSCRECNNRTSAADSLVAFLSRIHKHHDDPAGWQVKEGLKYLLAAEQGAPGLVREFFADGNARDTLMETPGGVLVPVSEMHAGPIARALLDVWSAKLAMALYHEHAGGPLPLDGGTYAIWFLNNGLDQPTGDNFLRILPGYGTLLQGRRRSASGQFDYRFNTDERSIVAALTHFHGNIHFFTIAMAEPATYDFPREGLPHGRFMRPGELLASMPKPPPAILMPEVASRVGPLLILPKHLRWREGRHARPRRLTGRAGRGHLMDGQAAEPSPRSPAESKLDQVGLEAQAGSDMAVHGGVVADRLAPRLDRHDASSVQFSLTRGDQLPEPPPPCRAADRARQHVAEFQGLTCEAASAYHHGGREHGTAAAGIGDQNLHMPERAADELDACIQRGRAPAGTQEIIEAFLIFDILRSIIAEDNSDSQAKWIITKINDISNQGIYIIIDGTVAAL